MIYCNRYQLLCLVIRRKRLRAKDSAIFKEKNRFVTMEVNKSVNIEHQVVITITSFSL